MSAPLVSIVVPSYNCCPYLMEALASAAGQTYCRKELVLVDDRSTDGSDRLIMEESDRIASWFPQGAILMENPRNEGAHATLNRAIEAGSGEYIFILNSDDLFEPNRLEVMMEAMLRQKAQLAFSAVRCIDAAGRHEESDLAREFESLPQRIERYPFAAAASAVENICVSSGNLAFHKTLFTRLGGFRSFLYVHDYDFFLRASLMTEPIFVPETTYLYRLHETNSFRRLKRRGRSENRLLWLETYAEIQEHHACNPRMLLRSDYVADVDAAVREYGSKKSFLFRHAASPFAQCTAQSLRRRLFDGRCEE